MEAELLASQTPILLQFLFPLDLNSNFGVRATLFFCTRLSLALQAEEVTK
jgi:hypothetical protein